MALGACTQRWFASLRYVRGCGVPCLPPPSLTPQSTSKHVKIHSYLDTGSSFHSHSTQSTPSLPPPQCLRTLACRACRPGTVWCMVSREGMPHRVRGGRRGGGRRGKGRGDVTNRVILLRRCEISDMVEISRWSTKRQRGVDGVAGAGFLRRQRLGVWALRSCRALCGWSVVR